MFTNIKDVEAYHNAVISAASEWIRGQASIDNQEEIAIIAAHYGVKLPACFFNFQYSRDPFSVSAYGAHKTILKALEKLAKKIVEKEGANPNEAKENQVYRNVLTYLCGVDCA